MTDMNHEPLDYSDDRSAFLENAISAEDSCISVGGLAQQLGMLKTPSAPKSTETPAPDALTAQFSILRVALSRFVELSRRSRKLTVEAFAQKSGLTAADVLQIEDEDAPSPEPRVIFLIATFLRSDPNKLMELAGHVSRRNTPLGKQAMKFAAWSQGTKPLTHEEEKILQAFTEVVVENNEKG